MAVSGSDAGLESALKAITQRIRDTKTWNHTLKAGDKLIWEAWMWTVVDDISQNCNRNVYLSADQQKMCLNEQVIKRIDDTYVWNRTLKKGDHLTFYAWIWTVLDDLKGIARNAMNAYDQQPTLRPTEG